MRANSTEKSQSSKCKISRTTTNAWVNKEKLLVASNIKKYVQEC